MLWSKKVAAVAVSAGVVLAVPAAGWAAPVVPRPVSAHPVSAGAVAGLRAQLRAGTLSRTRGVSKVCAVHHLSCLAQAVTVSKGSRQLLAFGAPIGYGATDLERAYGVSGSAGHSGTIAIIDAGAYPTLESDLTIYRDTYGLPRCTTASGCLTQVRYTGGPPYAPSTDPFISEVEEGVAVETALDVDMASAACPACKIVEVQVPALDAAAFDPASADTATAHFATASQTAVKLGAKAVSISYGYPADAYTDTGTPAKNLAHRGVAVFASSGDSGINLDGNSWPADLTTVIAAGGTSLYTDTTKSRGYTETAWNGAGSGCTPDLGPANGQPASVAAACDGSRADADLSAVADPYTGVAVYDSYAPASGEPYGFIVVGGTSASSPFLAGMSVRAGVPATVLGPNGIYTGNATRFNDVLIGANAPPGGCAYYGFDNRLCTAGPGWDGPTGRGTPKGLATFSTTP